MTDKIWLGGIFLKNEGGYEIILKAFRHYKKRLQTMGNSPELKEAAAMFAPVLQQQAVKIIPKIDETVTKIQNVLSDIIPINSLEDDIQLMQRALECYQSDIEKAENTGNEYFLKLLDDLLTAKKDSADIAKAINKINQFSE
uniref:Uncharacterized protein n=1 Tax=uncultured marine thaumarchaeote SAT1000_48_A08 TaxID=1456414 RepID=A0A075IBA8_9ARCH|nr:hypothetical protein [uncultured marine thaumarchaeote SAT1000_48_A08]|tara:strand:+ start:875 stop:1300 length:426 start_codon:yes stop_codon:yes gene_type:complete